MVLAVGVSVVSRMGILSRFLPRPASLVGLDIGSSSVKAVEVTRSATGGLVARAGVQPMPSESLAKGAIVNGPVVTDAIRNVLEAAGIRGRDVALSLPGSAVVAREISMPRMSPAELPGSIAWEAEGHIPFELRDVNLDYQVVGRGADSEGPTIVVLLAAAKKSTIADYAAVVAQAGCVPIVVDVAAFALQNAYATYGGLDGGGSLALLNAGASTINVNIVLGGRSVFTRDIAAGGNAYTDALRAAHSLTFGEAEKLKKGGGRGQDADAPEPAVREVTERLLLEVEKTFDFFAAKPASARLDRIVLSGGASRGREFAAAIEERFDASVERFDPFRAMTMGVVSAAGGDLADVAAAAGVAAGLALRQVGDR